MRWRKLISFCIVVHTLTYGLSQNDNSDSKQEFFVPAEAKASDVFSLIAEEFNVLMAYPSGMQNSISMPENPIKYETLDDLFLVLFENSSIEFRKIEDDKYLLRYANNSTSNDLLTVKGVVVDATSNEPLVLASVYLSDYSNGVFTDEEGRFSIECPAGTDSMIVSYLSYKSYAFKPDQNRKLSIIKLDRSDQRIENVLVEYVIPPIQLNTFSDEIILKNSSHNLLQNGGLVSNDVLRNVQLMAGVNAHDDDEASLKIRGSNADQSLIILDGMPLYHVDHYYGIFSAINPDYVNNVSLFRNNQPVQHAGSGGGMLLLDSDIIEKDIHGSADINLLSTTANLSLPISNAVQLSLGGRTTYRNVDDGGLINLKSHRREDDLGSLSQNTFISNEPLFRFFDVNGKLSFRLSPKSDLAINYFMSKDRFDNNYELNFQTEDSFVVLNENLYSNVEEWDNEAMSILYTHSLGDHLNLRWNTHHSAYNQSNELSSTLIRRIEQQIVTESIFNASESGLRDWGTELFLDFSTPASGWKFGFDYNRYSNQNEIREEDKTVFKLNPNSELVSNFADFRQRFGQWIFSAGHRMTLYHFNKMKKVFYSPQISIKYFLDPELQIKLSAGRTHQFLREIEYENRFSQTFEIIALANGNQVPVLRTDNIMAGLTYQKSAFSVDLELYYKKMLGNLQFTTSMPGFAAGNTTIPIKDYRLYAGDRKVLGMDLTISGKHKNYQAWLAYTLSKSSDRYNQIYNGNYFSSQDDRRHQVKWIHSLSFGRFNISNNLIFASGRPYLPLESLSDLQDRNNLNPTDLLDNLPPYFRADFGISYAVPVGENLLSFSVSVFNITNRQNVKYIQYAFNVNRNNPANNLTTVIGTETDLLDRTLNFGFGVKF